MARALGLVAVAIALSWRLDRPTLETDEITYLGAAFRADQASSLLPLRANGEPFPNKPPLHFLLMRVAFRAFEAGPFAARLVSVIAAVAAAVLLHRQGRRLFGPAAGAFAACAFVFNPGLLAQHGARSATMDALDILVFVAGCECLQALRTRRHRGAGVGLLGCFGISAWIKSPFIALVLLACWLGSEPAARRSGSPTPRLGRTVGLAAAAWCISFALWLAALGAASSARLVADGVVRQQYLGRIDGSLDPRQVRSPLHFAGVLRQDFGWLLLPAVVGAVWRLRASRTRGGSTGEEATALLAAVAAPALASLSAAKLDWYAYPAYPAIALLAGAGLERLAGARSRRRAVVFLAGLLALGSRVPWAEVWPPDHRWRSPVPRLWAVQARMPELRVTAPDLKLPRDDDTGREARLFINFMLQRTERRPDASTACWVRLVSGPPTGRVRRAARLLEVPRGLDLHLVDYCGGRVLPQVAPSASITRPGTMRRTLREALTAR